MRPRASFVLACALIAAKPAFAIEPQRTVTVAPGSRYSAGWLYGFFLGAHWRDAWTTPITVPVLDLESFDGGLRPDREGGGQETKNLHFKSRNGRTWAFRSVDKDPTRMLDVDTRESLIGDVIQDQTSSGHPRGLLYLGYSGMDQARFYGSDNDTPRDSRLSAASFYDANQRRFTANALLDVPLLGPLHGRAGALFEHAFSVDRSGIFAVARPDGSDGRSLMSPEAGLALDTRTGTFTSLRGVKLDVIGRHTPSILGNPAAFTKLRGEVSGWVGGHVVTDAVLGLRLAGERNWGSYPFFEAQLANALQATVVHSSESTSFYVASVFAP